MNKVRNFLVALGIGIVFIACFMIVSVLTKKPEKAIDSSFTTVNNIVTGVRTVARDDGAVLVFIDPAIEGSNEVLEKLIKHKGDAEIIAVSVSELDKDEQLKLLPKKARELEYLSFDGKEIIKDYNIGNAPVTYFIDSEFYVQDAFVGNISDKSVKKCIKKITE